VVFYVNSFQVFILFEIQLVSFICVNYMY